MHRELDAFAFLRIAEDFIVEVHVVTDVIRRQRVPLNMQMTGFKLGHVFLLSRHGRRADLGPAPGVSNYR
ncbi:hypothetical protein D3C81_2165620 [compost metagenome]